MFNKVGFIGTGNMGSAIAKSIKNKDVTIYLANRTEEKALALSKKIKGSVVCDNLTVARECNLIFIAVKPQNVKEVLEEISPILNRRRDIYVLCSMAASLTCRQIKEYVKANAPVIRIMPNTPCEIGSGVIQYCCLDTADFMTAAFEETLRNAGYIDRIEEDKIDAASAVSGCGPAFTYIFIEALADGGVKCGLSRKQAIEYAAKMVEGSAKMVLETKKHPEALKDEVTSPAGTTIEGVQVLEEHSFRAAVINAVVAAYEKNNKIK